MVKVATPVSSDGHATGEQAQPGPAIGLGGPTTAAWREDALTRVSELTGLADWVEAVGADRGDELKLMAAVRLQLERARKTAAGQDDTSRRASWRLFTRFKSSSGGSSVERTLGSLDAAETGLLRLAPSDYLRGLMPSLQAHVNRYLSKGDPRRARVDALVKKAEQRPLDESERVAVVAAYHAANSQRRCEILRLRSFRNVLLVAALGLLLVAVGLGILGSLRAHLIPLCFTPDQHVVCPTHTTTWPGQTNTTDRAIRATVSGWDIWLVETIGLVAAALASAFALRGIRGTSTPYSLPVALSILKLSTGALTAVLGVLLMRGGFVPGLSNLDTSAQILAWAIVFGYAQQLFTRMVDQQAQSVLNDVGGRGSAGDRLPAGHKE